jgi:hypothetical protein
MESMLDEFFEESSLVGYTTSRAMKDRDEEVLLSPRWQKLFLKGVKLHKGLSFKVNSLALVIHKQLKELLSQGPLLLKAP